MGLWQPYQVMKQRAPPWGVYLEGGCLARAGTGIQAQTRGNVGGKDKSLEP